MIVERTLLQIPGDDADATIEWTDAQDTATPLWRLARETDTSTLVLSDAQADQAVWVADEATQQVNFPVGAKSAGSPVLTEADEGHGQGLNADTVDTYEGADLAALAEDEVVTGWWNLQTPPTVSAQWQYITGFDGNAEHWWRYSNAPDYIFGVQRNGPEDYRLRINQGGSTTDVLTTADEANGDIDAGTLNGFTDSDLRADILDDGSTAVADAATIDFAGNLNAVNIGGGGVEINLTDEPTFDGLDLSQWNVVDAVKNGVDNTGATDVSADLQALAADNTLVVLRPGTYHVAGTTTFNSYDRFAIVGLGDATFEIDATHQTSHVFELGTSSTDAGTELHLRNLRFDYTADGAGGPAILAHVTRTLDFRDIHITGGLYDGPAIVPAIHDRGGVGHIRRLRMPDGAQTGYTGGTSGQGPEGVYIPVASVGTMHFENCYVANFPNNGMYLSAQDGQVVVSECTFVDNGVCGVRIGDGDVVENCQVYIEKASFDNVPRGVWLRTGHCTLRDTDIVNTSSGGYRGVVVLDTVERVTIDNVTVQFDAASGIGVEFKDPGANTNHGGLVTDLDVRGDATDPGFSPYAIECHRPKVAFVDCRTDMTNVGGLRCSGLAGENTIRGGDFVGAGPAIEVASADCTVAHTYAENTTGGTDIDLSGSTTASEIDNRVVNGISRASDTTTWPTQAALDSHAASANAHHTKTTPVAASDSGTQVYAEVGGLNFGTDLGVTDDGDGTVTIDYTGSGGSDTRVDVENIDGTTLVSNVSAIQAGTDLSFADDGDGSVTLDFTGSGGSDTRVDVENADATPLVSNVTAIQAGTDLSFTDDGDGSVTLDAATFSGSHGDLSNVTASDHHTRPSAGIGLSEDGSNNFDVNTVASGTVTLASGSAVVATGVTTTGTNIDVYLDPSGAGANTADVKVAARAFWDTAAGEYKVEILEDGTSVGNPDVGYRVVSA